MPQPRKPYTEEIRRLTDLGPITYHDLIREAANLVPDDLALKTGVRHYERHPHVSGTKHLRVRPSDEELTRQGAKAVIAKGIWQAEIFGYIQYRDEDGTRWVETGPNPWYVRGVTKPRRLGPGRPLTTWGEAIREHLVDGPQDLEYVLSRTAPLVPPGRAYRRTLQNREETRGRRGKPPPPDPKTDREKASATRAGQRQIVMFTIRNLLRYGRITKSDVGDKTMIEMGPNPW